MKKSHFFTVISIAVLVTILNAVFLKPSTATVMQPVKIFIDGEELNTDVQPLIMNGRTMVPIRAISEKLGMKVEWDEANRWVVITSSTVPVGGSSPSRSEIDREITILGQAAVSSGDLKTILKQKNPSVSTDIVDMYLAIGAEYGVKGDIAFCQAAKETGWWKFGGLVESYQNNYCGLGATGRPASGDEDLNGADPSKVWYKEGVHGAIFDSPETGVEAHIQHLYAYACDDPLPEGKVLVDPRFNLVSRGSAVTWSDLDGKWAVPGNGYGLSILQDYYRLVLLGNSESGV